MILWIYSCKNFYPRLVKINETFNYFVSFLEISLPDDIASIDLYQVVFYLLWRFDR